MKYTTITLTVAFLLTGAIGQGIGDLPACPRDCIFSGDIKSECSLIDVECTCRDLAYQQQLAGCMATCTPEDAAKGAQVGAAICKQAGVIISIPSITTTVSTPPPSTTSTTAAPVITTTPEVSTTTTSTSTTPVIIVLPPTTSSTPPTTTLSSTTLIGTAIVPKPSGNATVPSNSTATPPKATGIPPKQDEEAGAARLVGGGVLGAVVMGVIALAL